MTVADDHYDVLVVGSGPGGATTADETFYDLHDRPFRPELHYYVGGAVNPTLTIIVNALRVGDHIAERIGTGRRPEPATAPPRSLPAR